MIHVCTGYPCCNLHVLNEAIMIHILLDEIIMIHFLKYDPRLHWFTGCTVPDSLGYLPQVT